MDARGWDETALAAALEKAGYPVGPRTVYAWLTGLKTPTVEGVETLSAVLEKPVGKILADRPRR